APSTRISDRANPNILRLLLAVASTVGCRFLRPVRRVGPGVPEASRGYSAALAGDFGRSPTRDPAGNREPGCPQGTGLSQSGGGKPQPGDTIPERFEPRHKLCLLCGSRQNPAPQSERQGCRSLWPKRKRSATSWSLSLS